jgi:hypothetical protein
LIVYILNQSTVVTDEQVEAVIPAMHEQTWQLRRWWGSQAVPIRFGPPSVENAWQIMILDDSDSAGALGYHDFTPGGRPIGSVFAKTDIDNGLSWTVTLSHELLEMIIDPWISAAFQVADQMWFAAEVCDAVEAEKYAYEIKVKGYDPVLVSDFQLPNWFIPGSPGQFDWRDHCTEPLQILEGGYMYVNHKGEWFARDSAGKMQKPGQLPERQRLQMYARDRGSLRGA